MAVVRTFGSAVRNRGFRILDSSHELSPPDELVPDPYEQKTD
jgi:hypothetical protein